MHTVNLRHIHFGVCHIECRATKVSFSLVRTCNDDVTVLIDCHCSGFTEFLRIVDHSLEGVSPKPLPTWIGHSDECIGGAACDGDGSKFDGPGVCASHNNFATHANCKVCKDGDPTIPNRVVVRTNHILILARTVDCTNIEFTAVGTCWSKGLRAKGECLRIAGVPATAKGIETRGVFQGFSKFCSVGSTSTNKHWVRGACTGLNALNWI